MEMENRSSSIKAAFQDKAESISEELNIFLGIKSEVINVSGSYRIKADTIVGEMIYIPSEKTVMGDVYRFISNYGLKMHTWGLENKIKEFNTLSFSNKTIK